MQIESSSTNEGVPDLKISSLSFEFEFPALEDDLPVSPKLAHAKLKQNTLAMGDVPCRERASTSHWYVNVDAVSEASGAYEGTSFRAFPLPYFTGGNKVNLTINDEGEGDDSEADQPSLSLPSSSMLSSPSHSSSSASSSRSSTKLFNMCTSLDSQGISHQLLVKLWILVRKPCHTHDREAKIFSQGFVECNEMQETDCLKIHKRGQHLIRSQETSNNLAYQSHPRHKDGKEVRSDINCKARTISRFRAHASITQSNSSSPCAEHYAKLRERLRKKTFLPYRQSLLFGKSLFQVAKSHPVL